MPCLAAEDKFISSATQMINSKYKNRFSSALDEKVLRDVNIVKTKVSTTTSQVINVVSLSRGQLYSQVDRMCDIIFSFAITGITALLCLGTMQRARRESKVRDAQLLAQRIGLNQSGDPPRLSKLAGRIEATEKVLTYEKVAKTVKPLVYMLEGTIRTRILEKHPSWSTLEVEDDLTRQMRDLATDFMSDASDGHDATTHIKLLMSPYFLLQKTWLWVRCGFQSKWFNSAAIFAIILEVVVDSKGWDEGALYCIQGTIILALGLDVFINAVLEFTTSQPVSTDLQHKMHKETIVGIWIVPSLWMVLSFTSMSSQYYYCPSLPCQAKHYLYPLLLLMRNHTLWISIMAFGHSLASAAIVLLQQVVLVPLDRYTICFKTQQLGGSKRVHCRTQPANLFEFMPLQDAIVAVIKIAKDAVIRPLVQVRQL